MAKPSLSNNTWSISVDPRVELVCALECLSSGNPCPSDEKSRYLTALLRRLPRKHPAVERFAKMTPADWRHRHPSLIAMDFGPPPELEIFAYHEHYGGEGREDAISRLLPSMRDFAACEEFSEFFASSSAFYQSLVGPLWKGLEDWDYKKILQDYLGLLPEHRYHFILAPLYHGGTAHNVLYRRKDGSYDVYSISGHDAVKAGRPCFRLVPDNWAATAWHEVAHTVVDGITSDYKDAIEPLSGLYGLMTGIARSRYRGPQGWPHMVDEHIIRALTCRLTALTRGEEAGRRALEKERAEGFVLIGPFYEALKGYEKARDRYPTLRDYYPRFVETLQKLQTLRPRSR